jgi:DNA modification methylase
MNKLFQGDCLEVIKTLDDNSIDAIVTDPPYGLVSIQKRFGKESSAPVKYGKDGSFSRLSKGFMGKEWDGSGIEYNVEMWSEALRILKPGGYLLAFGGTRTCHRMTCAIEDAGFEIRDMIMYVYGSGFPKSTNIFKQLQKQCTCGNMVAYEQNRDDRKIYSKKDSEHDLRPVQESDLSQTINPKTKQGQVLQSGLSEQSTSAEGVQFPNKTGEGQPSVEGRNNVEANSRELSGDDLCEMSEGVSTNGEERRLHNATQISDGSTPEQIINENGSSPSQRPQSEKQPDREPCAFCKQFGTQALGAFGLGSALKPACEPITVARKPLSEKNLALNVLKWGTGGINIDESRVKTEDKTGREIYQTQSWKNTSTKGVGSVNDDWKMGRFPANFIHDGSDEVVELFPNESARFFYCAKASKSERNAGCEELEEKRVNYMAKANGTGEPSMDTFSSMNRNNHPTVKPIALMEYLVKLVSPKGSLVLDPFAGSGSTLIACKNLGRQYIGIELDPEYIKIAEARLKAVKDKLL